MQVPITKEENKPDRHPMYTDLHRFIPGEYLTSIHVRSKALIYALMTNCTKLCSVTAWLFLVHFLKLKIISLSDNFKEKKGSNQMDFHLVLPVVFLSKMPIKKKSKNKHKTLPYFYINEEQLNFIRYLSERS